MGKHQQLQQRKKQWRFTWIGIIPAICMVAALLFYLLPQAASWYSQWQQSKVVAEYSQTVEQTIPPAQEQIAAAHTYNDSLQYSAIYEAMSNKPKSFQENLQYAAMLNSGEGAPMARLQIPSIDLDLPIYHGTSDETLLRGLGHLEGTSLPVGGVGTRSVITGHRGLAGSKLFTDLNKVKKGDLIYVQVLGQVLRYRVNDYRIIEPTDTEAIRPNIDKDQITLITCTPLGINTQRILVTAERSEPVSEQEIAKANAKPEVPHFPWFIPLFLAGLALIAGYTYWSGLTPLLPLRKKPTIWFKRTETVRQIVQTMFASGIVMLNGCRGVGLTSMVTILIPDYLGALPNKQLQLVVVNLREQRKLARTGKLARYVLAQAEQRPAGTALIVCLDGVEKLVNPGALFAKLIAVPDLYLVCASRRRRTCCVEYPHLTVAPMNFAEYAADAPEAAYEEAWEQYQLYGGIPEIYQHPARNRDELLLNLIHQVILPGLAGRGVTLAALKAVLRSILLQEPVAAKHQKTLVRLQEAGLVVTGVQQELLLSDFGIDRLLRSGLKPAATLPRANLRQWHLQQISSAGNT